MAQSLIIKDGVGSYTYLATQTSSYGLVPIHYISSSAVDPVYVSGALSFNTASTINITASAAAPVYVTGAFSFNTGSVLNITSSLANPAAITGTVNVNNTVLTVTSSLLSPVVTYAYPAPVTTVAASSVTSFTWSTSESGTFSLAANSATRRGLTIFNPGPYNLYLALSTAGGVTNGFTLSNTASSPTQYSFIVYPSGTYTADTTMVGVYHGGYFISGAASSGVFISAIS